MHMTHTTSRDPRHALSGAKKLLLRIGMDPFVDWSIILALFLALAVAGTIAGWKDFDAIDAAVSAPPAPAAQKGLTILDVRALNSALQSLDSRAADRAALLKGYSGPGDPSL